MSKVWTITRMEFDVSDDGFISAETAISKVFAYREFIAAKEAFRSILKEIGDTDSIRDDFINALNEGLCNYYDESEKKKSLNKKKSILKTVVGNILLGRTAEQVKDEDYTRFDAVSDTLLDIHLDLLQENEYLELGDNWGIEGSHPSLKTNALFMNDPNKPYYFRLENSFCKDHKYFFVNITPVEVA